MGLWSQEFTLSKKQWEAWKSFKLGSSWISFEIPWRKVGKRDRKEGTTWENVVIHVQIDVST